jgi:hypothetical protein
MHANANALLIHLHCVHTALKSWKNLLKASSSSFAYHYAVRGLRFSFLWFRSMAVFAAAWLAIQITNPQFTFNCKCKY